MAALVDAAREADYPAEIVGVISDKAGVQGLRAAESFGIATNTIARSDYDSKEAHEAAIHEALAQFDAKIICLAGYMRLLSPAFVDGWMGKMINIHPSLLPSLRGLHTHRRALEAGMRVHGCTVHFVNHEMDSGPIIAQSAIPVQTNDTEEALTARMLKAEHRLYPLALALVAGGKARMDGAQTKFEGVDHMGGNDFLLVPGSWHGPSDIEGLARFTP
ncbi:phosphoribosylglycinamide formyltransferase [Mesorhizobium sp. NBSH29]|uniref:phosphoribosylglycinamide formyltransferase n=1 Tax=Mesorhizobium sp. NBSH29 TaxID=2654249 RepID=UPI0035BC5B7C